jgi:hypothetical protein
MNMPVPKPSAQPASIVVTVVTPRRDAYRAAADCLRSCANLSWSEQLHRRQGSEPPDALLLFADDFNMIDAYGAIERELLGQCVGSVVVVARHGRDYQSLTNVPGAANRLTILPLSGWETDVRRTILSRIESAV